MYGNLRSPAVLPLAALFAAMLMLAGCGGEEEPGQTTSEQAEQAPPPAAQDEGMPADTGSPAAESESPSDSDIAATEAPPTDTAATQEESTDTAATEAPTDTGAAAEEPATDMGAAEGAADGQASDAEVEAAINQAGCLACHTVDQRRIGPAYAWVAARYQGDDTAVDTLAQSITKGSQGKWADVTGGIPMPPNPQVNEEQARTFAKWVLSLEPQEPPQ